MNRPQLHRRPRAGRGFTPVVQAGRDLRYLSFGLLRLEAGDRHRLETGGDEAVVVLLQGSLHVRAPGLEPGRVGPRRGVFGGRAGAVYLPPGSVADVEAPEATGPAEAAVFLAPGTGEPGGQAFVVTPDQVRVQVRGRPGFEREVHDIVDARMPAQRLLVGETFNRAGEWSSYPPHKHDETIPGVETPLEEVYYFRVDPPQGFGVQVIYSPSRGVDEAYRILDGDVTLIPFGYHPVVAAPGYRVYYLWALAGQERVLCFHDDPAHEWVKGSPGG